MADLCLVSSMVVPDHVNQHLSAEGDILGLLSDVEMTTHPITCMQYRTWNLQLFRNGFSRCFWLVSIYSPFSQLSNEPYGLSLCTTNEYCQTNPFYGGTEKLTFVVNDC